MSLGRSVFETRCGRPGLASPATSVGRGGGVVIFKSAKAFPSPSPPPVDAQNFMYRSTILV